jgi:hypothetical protein
LLEFALNIIHTAKCTSIGIEPGTARVEVQFQLLIYDRKNKLKMLKFATLWGISLRE